MPILIYLPAANQAIGGIDEYTKLMLHMDGDQSDSQHTIIHTGVGATGNPQYSTVESKFGGSSIYFDGAGDDVYISWPTLEPGANEDFIFTSGDFTIDLWVYPSPKANYRRLVGYGADQPGWDSITGWHWIFGIQNDGTIDFQYQITGNTSQSVSTVVTITDNTWTHLAAVRTGSTIYVFVNGIIRATKTSAPDMILPSNGKNFCVATYSGETADTYRYIGYMDELRVSKGIARWTTDFTLPISAYTSDANTKLLLHFEGDVSTSAHVITSNGNPQLNATTAKFNGSMYFDGTGDFLTVGDHADFNFAGGVFTVDFWMYPTDIQVAGDSTNDDPIWEHWVNTTNRVHFFYDASASSLRLYMIDGGVLLLDNTFANTVMVNDTWYHVALVRSAGNTWTVYIDGVSKDSVVAALTYPDIAGNFRIGYNSEVPVGYTGYIDEFRISKGIARWTSNFTPESGPYTE